MKQDISVFGLHMLHAANQDSVFANRSARFHARGAFGFDVHIVLGHPCLGIHPDQDAQNHHAHQHEGTNTEFCYVFVHGRYQLTSAP